MLLRANSLKIKFFCTIWDCLIISTFIIFSVLKHNLNLKQLQVVEK